MISPEATAEAVRKLRKAGCVFAEDEAQALQEAAVDDLALAALVDRRATGEPVEQVVGWANFCGVRVHLAPGVFVPRVRSELLVETAAAQPATTVVDLCCGSGALGLALRHRRPEITLHAADLDPRAVACARRNLGGNVHRGDLFEALPPELRGRIDLLLANVPYVATAHIPFLPAEARVHEPHTALDGGDDGLQIFRRVAKEAKHWLSPRGLLISEITEAQTTPAIEITTRHGLTPTVVTDDDLDARAILARFL
ncbi:putative protein N(5)-glutamine methyltransferase [Actinoplanes couchii]|uniref:peptide chain release factor N(5)-glutamine methyltransferase n=1 Tax=Actinoplanes couchii TaxID=403638 RepID=A0ABQ3XS21_9ACTN|nr:putative protein N(5)-glutamine methyltransferase [Actinoplanes couchii]MDR6323062.1 release factor glutamine methyltransferase [Actinoplanes couchii]GID61314.1 methylase [Actinoplanes couchii]